MVVCKFFLQGTCKFGTNCKFQHAITPDPYHYVNPNLGGATSILRQPTTNYAKPNQTAPIDTATLVKSVVNEAIAAEKGGQWPLTCYAPFKEKPAFPGLEDTSFEEVRLGFYEARENGTLDQYTRGIQEMLQVRMRQLKALQNPSPDIVKILQDIYDTPVNAGQSTNNPFGGNTNSTPFGQASSNSVFGGSTSIFGGQTTQPQSFQQNTQPGGNIFQGGAQNTQQSIFGGQQSTQQPFGGQSATSSSIFGGATPQQNSSIFGGATNQSVFGQNVPQSNIFAQNVTQSQNQGIFGGNQPQNQGIFGGTQHQTTNSIFGASQSPPQGIFGGSQPSQSTPQTTNTIFGGTQPPLQGIFGGNQPQPQQSIFAQQNFSQPQLAQPQNPFGGPQAFVQPQTQPPPQNNLPFGQTPLQTQPPSTTQQSIFKPVFGGTSNTQPQKDFEADASIYSKLEDLSPEEIEWFKKDHFELNSIPEKPPTLEMCQ